MLVHGSLFSGLGGFDLAAEQMGWENAFHCEWEPFCQKILRYYWPKATSYEDIRNTDFTVWRGKLDILTGGFPCQPFSVAGQKKGVDDTRYLWPQMLRAIREIKPACVLPENVSGLISMGVPTGTPTLVSKTPLAGPYHRYILRKRESSLLERICQDLEKEGYQVQPFDIPAAGLNAPHYRRRVWIVAYSAEYRRARRQFQPIHEYRKGNIFPGTASEQEDETHSNQSRCKKRHMERSEGLGGDGEGRIETNHGPTTQGYGPNARHSQSPGFPVRHHESNGPYSGFVRSDSEPYWKNFPTQSPVCGRDDGLPRQLDGITFPSWRRESIKGFGNAVVVPLVLEIFKAIQSTWFEDH